MYFYLILYFPSKLFYYGYHFILPTPNFVTTFIYPIHDRKKISLSCITSSTSFHQSKKLSSYNFKSSFNT